MRVRPMMRLRITERRRLSAAKRARLHGNLGRGDPDGFQSE